MWLEIEVHEDEVDTKIFIIINNVTNFVIIFTLTPFELKAPPNKLLLFKKRKSPLKLFLDDGSHGFVVLAVASHLRSDFK